MASTGGVGKPHSLCCSVRLYRTSEGLWLQVSHWNISTWDLAIWTDSIIHIYNTHHATHGVVWYFTIYRYIHIIYIYVCYRITCICRHVRINLSWDQEIKIARHPCGCHCVQCSHEDLCRSPTQNAVIMACWKIPNMWWFSQLWTTINPVIFGIIIKS